MGTFFYFIFILKICSFLYGTFALGSIAVVLYIGGFSSQINIQCYGYNKKKLQFKHIFYSITFGKQRLKATKYINSLPLWHLVLICFFFLKKKIQKSYAWQIIFHSSSWLNFKLKITIFCFAGGNFSLKFTSH